MKQSLIRTFSSASLAAILIVAGARMAEGQNDCSISTLKASYGFATTGFINFSSPGPSHVDDFFPVAVAGTVKFRSDGTVSRSVKVSLGGSIFPVIDSGTYTLNSDCTFTVNHGNGEVWILTPVKHGTELMFFVNDAGGVGAGTLVQQ